MSDTTPNAKGPAPVQYTPKATEPALVPADQVKPEDMGALSLRYVDDVAQLVVSGGTAAPAAITIVDGSGSPVGIYTVGLIQAPTIQARRAVPAPATDPSFVLRFQDD
ncbi:hypothetical protein ACGFRG_25615 [Streptomyces sp. NPDC048696]|uniref:hypothetical protein n=1 Tax=Streptomyces sp. NPDC048696 TaxID=3365585 RepID=UPI00371A77EA